MVRKLGCNFIAIEVLLISLGTAAPDLMSAAVAIFEGQTDISIGSILGSNFTNLTLGFGLASLFAPFKCEKKITILEFPLLLVLTIVFIFFCIDGKLSRLEGIALLVSFAAYVSHILCGKNSQTSKLETENNAANSCTWHLGKSIFTFILSSILLGYGAHLLVASSCQIADSYGISKTFIGFSLLAFGTSAPEIFVVIMAAKQKRYEICSGNIIGSSLVNLTLVAGLCATAHPFSFQENAFLLEAIAILLPTLTSWYIFKTKKTFSRMCGLLFIAMYLLAMLITKNF
jgi:cation:H+ antiporter